MSARFEVLDTAVTPLGVVSLRRRWDAVASQDVFEVEARRRVLDVQPVHRCRAGGGPAGTGPG